MIRIEVTDREGAKRTVEGEVGSSVMEVIRDNGFDELLAMCGGCCSCATCHVYVADQQVGELQPMSEDEDDLLEGSSFRTSASRLSCQINCIPELDGLRVKIAPED